MTTPTPAVRGLVPGARLVGVSMRDRAVGIAAVRSGAVTAHEVVRW